MAENKDKIELKDEELTSVQGGSFVDGGQTWSSDGNHRLIVTALYSCDLWRSEINPDIKKTDVPNRQAACKCWNCAFSERDGVVLYCNKRLYDNDPLNTNDNWHTTSGRF